MRYCEFLTLYALMDSSFWFDAINLGWSIVYTERSQVIISTKNVFLTLNNTANIMRHFICVFNICQSPHLGVTSIERVN